MPDQDPGQPPPHPAPEHAELKFHENARALAVREVRSYGERLVQESVSTARSRRHPLVLKKDVQYALHLLRRENRNRRSVVLQFLGAGLLGVFLQGFTAEMLGDAPQPWIAVAYVVIGFIGIFGVFWSLIR